MPMVAERYGLRNVLGRGGMGTVWAGRDELLRRDVAVKEVAPPAELPDGRRKELRERTLREARAAARIRSASAVTVYDVIEQDDRLWIVMERLDGGTLADLVADLGRLPPDAVARIGLGVLDALEAANAAGVLHRDVKPANVMFRVAGDPDTVVLSDFGIAHFDGDSALTITGTVIGSPAYLAPERARGDAATAASDLWSLGVLLFTAVEGYSPFQRSGLLPTLTAVLTEDVPPYRHAGPLAPVLDGLLQRDPAARPHPATVRAMLGAVLAPSPQPSPQPSPPEPARPAPAEPAPAAASGAGEPTLVVPLHRRRGPLLAALVAVLLVAGALTVPFLPWRSGDRGRATTASRPPAGATTTSAAPTTGRAVSATRSASALPATPSVTPAVTPSVTPSAIPSRSPTAPAGVPAGWRRYADPTGFSVAVPSRWTAQRRNGRVYLREPGSSRYLMVDQTDHPKGDPYADWLAQEPAVRQRLTGYRRISIERVDYRGWDAADWEFTWGSRTHVLNRNVITGPGHAYALYWSVPDSGWDADLARFRTMAATFTPAG